MASPPKPRFDQGVSLRELADGQMLSGTVGEDEVLLVRHAEELFAIGAYCSHYHGALERGLLVDGTVRCPLHHACFDLRTGRALRAPALDAIGCWRVERQGEQVYVRTKIEPPRPSLARSLPAPPKSMVIVGGGAAGTAAAIALRDEGYAGAITMLSADDSAPCDRPNLSKDYLAGTAQEEWLPLRPAEFYTQQHIELLLNTRVAALDAKKHWLTLHDGRQLAYEALLLATGAEPVRLSIAGAHPEQICQLRSFADGRALVARAAAARRVAVIGASFIGLEVAASLRARGIEVHVIAPERIPMQRVLGPEVGQFIRALHEAHGVHFHLGSTAVGMAGRALRLSDGSDIQELDFVVVGVGVRPDVELAEAAGLATDHGVLVDAYLQTSATAVFAAGDIARWPDPLSGERIRVEHWVVAERQGRVAARNMLGQRERFEAVPFFWSQHYDVTFNYVGHAESWDAIEVEGTLESRQCTLRYRRSGRTLAVVTVGHERDSLQAEHDMEGEHGA